MQAKFAHAVPDAAAVAMVTASSRKSEGEAGENASAAAGPVSGATVVKIGHAAHLTGGVAHLGKDNENGARLAVEDINAQGLTIDGHRIELQFDARAAATSPETGTQVANATACGILTKIKRVQPDVIVSGRLNATGGLSAKQAAPGSRAKILGGDGVCTDKVGKLAGDAAQRPVRPQAHLALAKVDQAAGFGEKPGDRFHTPAQIDAPFTYDAVYVIVDAMKRASSTDAPLLRVAMPLTGYMPVTGEIASDGKGDLQEGAITFYDFRDGSHAVLDVVKM